MRTGILGGTFNPIHNGHIEMARIAAKEMELDDIILIPTGAPPHKDSRDLISKYERYELCLLSAAEYDNFFVSSVEIDREGCTYTIDTLKELERSYGIRDDLFFIIGGDTVLKLDTWKDFEEVFKRCSFIAFGRAGMDSSEITGKITYLENTYSARIKYISARIQDVASRELREMIRNGESVEGLIPRRAAEYIERHNLYR